MCIVYIQSICKCMIVHVHIVSSDCMATLIRQILFATDHLQIELNTETVAYISGGGGGGGCLGCKGNFIILIPAQV